MEQIMKKNISTNDEMTLAYINYCKKNHKYFEYDFLKDKTLKEILYSPMRKMFLNLGASMFLCQILLDIARNIQCNQDCLDIDTKSLNTAIKKFKIIISLFNKILDEFEVLIKIL